MCNYFNKVTEESDDVPLMDHMEQSDIDLPLKEQMRQKALNDVNSCLERQKNLLTECGEVMEDPIVLDFAPKPFDDNQKTLKQRLLARVMQE